MQPKVSVISSVYNSEKDAEKFLECLYAQTYKNFELIIIQDKSNDKTEQIIRKTIKRLRMKNVIYKINKTRLGIAATRNKCIKIAKGIIIVNIDSDCYADKNWLKNIIKHVGNKTVVMGRTKSIYSNIWSRLEADSYEKFIKSHLKEIYLDILDTRQCAFKKNVFGMVGYFNPKLSESEDKDFGIRLIKSGYKIYYATNAVCLHNEATSLWTQFKKSLRRATTQFIVSKKHNLPMPRHINEGRLFFVSLFIILPLSAIFYYSTLKNNLIFILPAIIFLLSMKTTLKDIARLFFGKISFSQFIFSCVRDIGFKTGHIIRIIKEVLGQTI